MTLTPNERVALILEDRKRSQPDDPVIRSSDPVDMPRCSIDRMAPAADTAGSGVVRA